MNQMQAPTVAYVVKRYPVYSQTFIVNEILAHEAAGFQTMIISLRPPNDAHFQDAISRVRAPVHYLSSPDSAANIKAADLWSKINAFDAWPLLESMRNENLDDLYRAFGLAQFAKQHGIQHLHAHFATSATSTARLAARIAGLTYSFTAHAKDIFADDVAAPDLHRKIHDASAVMTVSDYNRLHLTRSDTASNVYRVYNGLDLNALPYTPPSPNDKTSHKILAVGRLVEKKGFADLIDACAQLSRQYNDFTCDIIGEGEQRRALQAQIQQHGLQERVRLLGALPQQDVFAHMRNATILVAPCIVAGDNDRDGMPTVLLEAMALGTPCIATNVAGIAELVRHDDTGLLVPERSPAALVNAIARLLYTPTLRQQLAQRARALMEHEFSAKHTAAQLRQIWHMVAQPEVLA